MRRSVLSTLILAGLTALPAAVVAYRAYFAPGLDWVQPIGTHFGLDFVNFWSAGRLASEGLVPQGYAPDAYSALLHQWFAPALKFTNLSYPPSLLIWLTPFAAIPFLWSYLVWTVLGVMATLAAALGRLPTRHDVPLVAALMIAPMTISNAVFGQIAPVMAMLFVTAFRVLPTRPILAGVLLGFLTMKPQLCVLLPAFLLAIGAWRTIASATLTATALVALSIALFGIGPWQAYLTDTAQLQWHYILTMEGFYAFHMTTPFAGLVAVGMPIAVALKVQWIVSAALVLATVIVARSSADWPLKVAVLGLGTLMAVPYALAHDLVLPLTALVWYWSTTPDTPKPSELALIGALWFLPFPETFLLQARGMPATELMMAALYGVLVSRALKSNAPILQYVLPTRQNG